MDISTISRGENILKSLKYEEEPNILFYINISIAIVGMFFLLIAPVSPKELYQEIINLLTFTEETKFDKTINPILKLEGYKSNHPLDKGGKTKYGITEATAKENGYKVEDISKEDAKKIYKEQFWPTCKDYEYPASLTCLNSAVNSGIQVAEKFKKEIDDNQPTKKIALKFLKKQNEYYKQIIKNDRTQIVFKRGWGNRSKYLKDKIL